MNKMIENEMNSIEFQEEEAPLFDFKQLWMLFVLNWRWFIASVVACVMIAFTVITVKLEVDKTLILVVDILLGVMLHLIIDHFIAKKEKQKK